MPRYAYKCTACEVMFNVTHSISERLEDCEECDTKGTLKKVLGKFNVVRKNSPAYVPPAGSIVKKHIEETKEAIREYKKEAKKDYIP